MAYKIYIQITYISGCCCRLVVYKKENVTHTQRWKLEVFSLFLLLLLLQFCVLLLRLLLSLNTF